MAKVDKVQLKAYIDKKVMDSLWDLIKKKYKKPYGALSSEVQDAIVHWVSLHEETLDIHTNTQTKVNPTLPRSHRDARGIVDDLRDRGFTLQVGIRELEKSIGNTRGSDGRTVKKWTRFLLKEGYLKQAPTARILEIL